MYLFFPFVLNQTFHKQIQFQLKIVLTELKYQIKSVEDQIGTNSSNNSNFIIEFKGKQGCPIFLEFSQLKLELELIEFMI